MSQRRKNRSAYPVIIFMILLLCAAIVLSVSLLLKNEKESGVDPSSTSDTEITEVSPPEETDKTENEKATETPNESATENGSEEDRLFHEIFDGMTVDEKVYQLFMVAPEAIEKDYLPVEIHTEQLKNGFVSHPVGGVILFSDNIRSDDQVTSLISAMQGDVKIPLFVACDEEGGAVSRLGSNPKISLTHFPDMADIQSENEAYNVGYTIGSGMKSLGFNLDFAPVADVFSNPANGIIGKRSFSSSPEICAAMVASEVKGFRDAGMLSTLKHFPGHGDTAEDSHYSAAVSNKTKTELEECEFVPFRSGIGAGVPFVMIGHISLPNVTGNSIPASMSKYIVTDILRTEMGFNGIIITDSMQMAAVSGRYSSAHAAIEAFNAGCDIILMPADLDEAAEGILNAIGNGEISIERLNESVERIIKTKIRYMYH